MRLVDPVRKIYSNIDGSRQAVNIIAGMRDKFLPDYTLILIDHEGSYDVSGIRPAKKTIVILSFIFDSSTKRLIAGLEPLRFNVILPYNASPILDSDIGKDYATGKIIILNRNRSSWIGVYIDRKNKSAILVLNDVLHRGSDSYLKLVEYEMAQIFARLAVELGVDNARLVSGMLNLVESYNTPKIALIINNAILEETETYKITLTTTDKIKAKLTIEEHPIKGYTSVADLDDPQGIAVTCNLEDPPLMKGTIVATWDINGNPLKLWHEGFTVQWRGRTYPHENIDDDGDGVCAGTWDLPKIDVTRDISEQIRRIMRELLSILEYPNEAHRYQTGIGNVLKRECRKAENIREEIWSI